MKKQQCGKFAGSLFALAAMSLCLPGCGGSDGGKTTEEAFSASEEASVVEIPEMEASSKNIPVDFPFYKSEEYLLALVPSEAADGEYVLTFWGEDGQVLQQIPCGCLTQPVTFSYDGIAYGSWRDMEIFSDGSDTGLLFMWKDDRFSEEPIQIPRYVEERNGAMLTVTEDGKIQEKRIFQLNECKKQTQEVRSWSLDRGSGTLRIWDDVRQQCLFEGEISLDEEGGLINEEYYEYLFWEDRDLLWDYSADPVINVWLNEERAEEDGDTQESSGFETVQNQVFGNLGHTAQYESRQAFLESCGYAGEEPFYQYYDRLGDLQLELYLDEEAQKCYGITYVNRINCDKEKVADLYGFTVCNIGEAHWEEDRTLSMAASETIGDRSAEGYQEKIEYAESGKPDYYLLTGPVESCGEETAGSLMGRLVEINYIYREDGTLFTRHYWHDSLTYSTTLCSLHSFFDENERIVFESGYITHGSYEYYYIYEDEGREPSYCLMLDHNVGYAIPSMVRFQ